MSNPSAPKPRKSVAAMHPYVPGEQPKDAKLIKLNTNENPYPPSPKVREALAALTDDRLRKYPDPVCLALRESIASSLGVGANQVIASNGSDEILKMIVEAWVEPGEKVAYLWPTYSLYPVFVEKAEAVEMRLPWKTGERTQEESLASAPREAKVIFVTNPNPPIGLGVSLDAIRALALDRPSTVVVVDEAYIAYGGESAVALIREGIPNVVVTRSFSKSHSLAGMRVGFGVGSADAIDILNRVKDSYNVGVAAQVAARAAWEDAEYTDGCVGRIRATRERVAERLRSGGFEIEASEGNFLFARRSDAREVFHRLREEHVLVRYFDTPELADGIRITIGTDAEMDEMLRVMEL